MLSLKITPFLKATFYLIRATFKLVYTQESGIFHSHIALMNTDFQIYAFFPFLHSWEEKILLHLEDRGIISLMSKTSFVIQKPPWPQE